RVARGDRAVTIDGMAIPVPEIREDLAEGELVLGLRPEHVRLDEAGPLKGTVFGTEYLGTTQIVAIDTPRGPIKARLPAAMPIRAGETVRMSLAAERLSLFDGATGRAILTTYDGEGRAHG
ncbi:TOBE domain-containing protein, partial [Mycobacterium sp. KBS0706]|uniref:TOBE domain-containing protein n=1 Tax=Mycobacterium sp. KBS0706 TaxID=2578109 RepID=UPI00117C2E68